MKKLIILLAILALANTASHAQQDAWRILSDVEFKREYIAKEKEYFLTPVFGSKVMEMEGQEIQVKGYVIPLDFDTDIIILSAFPFSSCFFCGAAGPESVIEIHPKKAMNHLKMDQIVTFKGRLRLNSQDIEMMNYILEDAEIVN